MSKPKDVYSLSRLLFLNMKCRKIFESSSKFASFSSKQTALGKYLQERGGLCRGRVCVSNNSSNQYQLLFKIALKWFTGSGVSISFFFPFLVFFFLITARKHKNKFEFELLFEISPHICNLLQVLFFRQWKAKEMFYVMICQNPPISNKTP